MLPLAQEGSAKVGVGQDPRQELPELKVVHYYSLADIEKSLTPLTKHASNLEVRYSRPYFACI